MLAQLCNDEQMLDAYRHGQDLYSKIAAVSFNSTYEDCKEFYPEGTPIKKVNGQWIKCNKEEADKLADGHTDTNKEGKERRSQAKLILLGMLYGRGDKALSEQLNCSLERAKAIKNLVYKGFPAIKELEVRMHKQCKEVGYVQTLWGRKRRLPEYRLDDYEFYKNNKRINKIQKYIDGLNNHWGYEKRKYIQEVLEKDGIKIVDNTRIKADAGRQIINSIVQGSSADMSKKAMIRVVNDENLKKLKCMILVPIHDEILIQSPLRYAKESSEYFAKDMELAATDKLTIPVNCDVTCSYNWYTDEISIDNELKELKGDI